MYRRYLPLTFRDRPHGAPETRLTARPNTVPVGNRVTSTARLRPSWPDRRPCPVRENVPRVRAHLDPTLLEDVVDLVDRAGQPTDLKLAVDTRAAIPLPVAFERIMLDVRRQCRRSGHGRCEQD